MENSSLPTDVAWNNGTTASLEDDVQMLNLPNVRRLAFKIIYGIIGTIGVIDNLLVLVVFIFFIKITSKVFIDRRNLNPSLMLVTCGLV